VKTIHSTETSLLPNPSTPVTRREWRRAERRLDSTRLRLEKAVTSDKSLRKGGGLSGPGSSSVRKPSGERRQRSRQT
jgi:hypothetical protein